MYLVSLEPLEDQYKFTRLFPPIHRKLRYEVNEVVEKISPHIAEECEQKRSTQEFLPIFIHGVRFIKRKNYSFTRSKNNNLELQEYLFVRL